MFPKPNKLVWVPKPDQRPYHKDPVPRSLKPDNGHAVLGTVFLKWLEIDLLSR